MTESRSSVDRWTRINSIISSLKAFSPFHSTFSYPLLWKNFRNCFISWFVSMNCIWDYNWREMMRARKSDEAYYTFQHHHTRLNHRDRRIDYLAPKYCLCVLVAALKHQSWLWHDNFLEFRIILDKFFA
jgi:hypothetical protein